MRLSDLRGQRVGVWGYGREGKAAISLLRTDSNLCVVTDGDLSSGDAAELAELGVPHFAGAPGAEQLASCDVVIRSPGISIYRDDLIALKAAGVVITTGSDLWFAEPRTSRVVGVTGTKGKSTSASLIAHLLAAQGRSVELAGNIGRPLLDLVGRPQSEFVVVEVSSHQASDLTHSPDVGMVTNLHREHLDWHRTVENYQRDKINLLRHNPQIVTVFCDEDEMLHALAPDFADVRWYGGSARFHLEGTNVMDGSRVAYCADDIPLLGRHNRLNLCGVLTVLDVLGAAPNVCHAALLTFVPLRHRLQPVAEQGGLTFIDDSISTTPIAVRAALEAIAGKPVTILLGGYERNQEYSDLIAELLDVPELVAVVTLPDNGSRISDEIEATWPCQSAKTPAHERASDLADGVRRAIRLTPAGGVVLLSPGAPSFGHFRDYEERGDAFAAAAIAHAGARASI